MATVNVMQGLLIGGFAPSVIVYLRKSKWWVNPIVQPKAWGSPNTPSMSLHALLTASWMAVAFFQFGITGIPNLLNEKKTIGGIKVKDVHRAVGYAGFAISVGMTVSALHLTYLHGVAGRVTNNGVALVTGGFMAYHMVKGIQAIRKYKDRKAHLWHMSGLFAWTCFPGFARILGFFPLQYLLFGSKKDAFDITDSNGWVAFPLLCTGIGHLLIHYSVLGPEKSKIKKSDMAVYVIGGLVEAAIGLIDGAYLRKPEKPILTQVPGKPWVLQ